MILILIRIIKLFLKYHT